MIVPLNDLIEEHAPHIKEVLENNEYYKAMNTAPDGKIYGLTGLNECFHCSYPNKMWINTKWLEQLGLAKPTTPEEFKAVLEAFKTQDPNGNGKADEVPLSGSVENFGVHVIPYLMNGFIYNDDRTYLIMKEGMSTLPRTNQSGVKLWPTSNRCMTADSLTRGVYAKCRRVQKSGITRTHSYWVPEQACIPPCF